MDTKVNYYFNKIIYYLIKIKGDNKVYYEDTKLYDNIESSIKNNIKMLINDNKDHLLTDSFIYYLVSISLSSHRGFSREVIEILERLNMQGDNNVIIFCLFDYASRLFVNEHDREYNSLPHFMREIDNIKLLFTDLEKKLYEEVKDYNYEFQFYFSDMGYDNTINSEKVHNITTGIILSSALLHQDFDEFDRLMTNYMDDPINVTEKLVLNGLVRKDKWSNEIEFTTMWEPLVSYLINDSTNKRGIL